MGTWKTPLQVTQRVVKLLVTAPNEDELVRCRLPSRPCHPRAALTLLEGLALWSGKPLCVATFVVSQGAPLAPDAKEWPEGVSEMLSRTDAALSPGTSRRRSVRVPWKGSNPFDEAGGIRVGETRVTLDALINGFRAGATPEELALQFSTLELRDIHATISFYLSNQLEVDAHLEARTADAAERRSELAKENGLAGLREGLLRRRDVGNGSPARQREWPASSVRGRNAAQSWLADAAPSARAPPLGGRACRIRAAAGPIVLDLEGRRLTDVACLVDGRDGEDSASSYVSTRCWRRLSDLGGARRSPY